MQTKWYWMTMIDILICKKEHSYLFSFLKIKSSKFSSIFISFRVPKQSLIIWDKFLRYFHFYSNLANINFVKYWCKNKFPIYYIRVSNYTFDNFGWITVPKVVIFFNRGLAIGWFQRDFSVHGARKSDSFGYLWEIWEGFPNKWSIKTKLNVKIRYSLVDNILSITMSILKPNTKSWTSYFGSRKIKCIRLKITEFQRQVLSFKVVKVFNRNEPGSSLSFRLFRLPFVPWNFEKSIFSLIFSLNFKVILEKNELRLPLMNFSFKTISWDKAANFGLTIMGSLDLTISGRLDFSIAQVVENFSWGSIRLKTCNLELLDFANYF